MKITPRVALEVAAHEGIVREAYKDSVGVWTWSIGITSASGHKVERYINNPQPMSKCLEVWIWVLEQYADDVAEAFEGYDLNEHEFGAALSFHYNTGAIKRASWVDAWKAGNIADARRRFMMWDKPAEIIGRREAECKLFFDGDWSNDGKVAEYTRVRSSGTPDWGSLRRVDIRETVESLIGRKEPAIVRDPDPQAPGFIASLIAIFRQIFGGTK